ncbi:hypothetical protein [Fibrella aquatica]|uniref:hypothetical protein n=1 Tax=Fibrella aquatica TaxID=3242487 RepID=UPI0035211A09
MQREKPRTSALKPSDNQSLFKFRLEFHPSTEEYTRKGGKPWIWYSYDKPDERDLFPPALAGRMRDQWQMVLQRTFRYPDLYDLLKDCYPVQKVDAAGEEACDAMTTVWMPLAKVHHADALSLKYDKVIGDILTLVGWNNFQFNHSNKLRMQPGFSPRLITNRDFYGIQAFEQNAQIAYWFATRKLRLVTVYDNRCYHADNKIGTIGPDQYPEPKGVLAPPPRLKAQTPGATAKPDDGRSRESVSVGSLLKHVATPATTPPAVAPV